MSIIQRVYCVMLTRKCSAYVWYRNIHVTSHMLSVLGNALHSTKMTRIMCAVLQSMEVSAVYKFYIMLNSIHQW